MTIKKIAAISVIASGLLVGSTAFAGTFEKVGSTTGKVAEELFQVYTDYNVSISNYAYKVSLNGSTTVNGPTFKFFVTDGNVSGADLSNIVIKDRTDANRTVTSTGTIVDGALVFSAISGTTTVYSGHQYQFSYADDNATAEINATVKQGQVNNLSLRAELWSTSGTEQLRDSATAKLYTLTPQYNVVCENKLSGLINVANSSKTFVSTRHGVESTSGNSDMNTSVDIFKFKVVKTAVDYGLDGNNSVLKIYNYDSNLTASEHNITGVALAGGNISIKGTTWDNNVTVELNTTNALKEATNEYIVKFDANNSMKPTKFTASFWVGDTTIFGGGDANGTVKPAAPTYVDGQSIGQWKDFAYIGQIAGATEDAYTKTKLFITNRGCTTVTPKLTLINGGKTVTVDLASIAPDAQGKYLLGNVISANQDVITDAGLPTSGRYAVEITIPGNAEDFYVYAQAQSKTDITATKDLPVYNTSSRGY